MIATNGSSYEEVRPGRTGNKSLKHHRVLAFAWGLLDSVFFTEDMREVHHDVKIRWLNTEENLEALSPEEHREEDPGRARIDAPWDQVGGRA